LSYATIVAWLPVATPVLKTTKSGWAALAQLAERATPHADDPLTRDARDVERRVGDLLFAVVNLAQRVGVDAEQALRDRALMLRGEIRRAEGVPDAAEGNR